jgi:electron transport complex protein RnfG
MKIANIKPTLVLCTICLVVALLLSGVNTITGPIIEAAQNAAANEALLEVLPDGKNFEEITLTPDYPAVVTAGYKADGGFVFQMTVTGKSAGMVIMCGIDADGKVVGTKVIANEETPGYAAKVFPEVEGQNGKYTGMDLSGFDPYLVSGATLTSKAFGEAIKAALQSAVLAAGGSVDTRTPEQILQDNCNAAAGTENVTYTKWFALEVIEGIDTIYEAQDGSARVYVFGESFVGVKNGAVVTTDASEANKEAALAADAIIGALTLEDVDKPTGTKATVKSIKKASNGAYVFEMSADGYQAMFDYGDGTPISFKISISADGKIIDVLTISHKETAGLGDACASEEYYEQYRGKGDEDITISSKYPDHDGTDLIPSTSTDVGIIASATYTTVGYQTAVKNAFAAFKLLTEGGNQ